MRLAHDVLDTQVVDRHGRRFGKVDGLVLEVRPGQPPVLVALEIGGLVLARRLHGRLAAWLSRRRHWGPFSLHALRVPWRAVRAIRTAEIHLDLDATRTPLWTLERWLAERVVGRLPGGS
jgi:sporulation protein YlmC with PRC-barrel domain